MLKLPSPNVAAETHCLPFVQRCVRSSCSSWQIVIQAHAMQLAVKETKLYENLTARLSH